MSVTLLQLRAFAATVEHGSFGSAAAELGLTQSAVSHAVASLEREIGGNVLTRRPRVAPTALGKQLLPHAETALRAADAIEAAAKLHGYDASGEVRLGTVRTASYGLIPALLQSWRAAYPSIKVRLFEGDDDELPLWLEAGLLDAAILVDPTEPPNGAVLLGCDRYAVILPKDHPLAEESCVSPSDLIDDPMVLSDSGCAPYVKRIMTQANPQFRPVSVVRDASALLSMVAAGIGVCLLPEIGRAMLPADLVMVRLEPSEERQLFFAGPANRDWIGPVQRLAEFCLEHPLNVPGLSTPHVLAS